MDILRNLTDSKIIKPNAPSRGNGLTFDGVNDKVNVPYNSNFSITNDFTLSIIFKFTSFSTIITGYGIWDALINKSDFGGGWAMLLSQNTFFLARDGGNISINFNYSFSLTTIYNIVVSLSATEESVYINNVREFVGIKRPYNDISTSVLRFGNDLIDRRFGGVIYDCKIFNKSLTQSEVELLYKSNNNIIPNTALSNIVANYTFNQKQSLLLNDSSGNNHTGTLINYSVGDTTLGAGNSWVDENGNPILV